MDETDDSYSDDSFVLYQVRAKINLSKTQDKIPKKMHLIANLPYRLKQYQTRHKYLRVRLDTCADVNIMPRSVYQMMFNVQGLSVLFACIGSGDPVRVLHLYTTNTLDVLLKHLLLRHMYNLPLLILLCYAQALRSETPYCYCERVTLSTCV